MTLVANMLLVQRHWRQILLPVPLVLLITVANLPPSKIPAANCHRYQRHRWQIYWWQIMGTMSDYWHLKVTWRKKFIYMLTLLPKGVPKNSKNFSDWRFFHLLSVSMTWKTFSQKSHDTVPLKDSNRRLCESLYLYPASVDGGTAAARGEASPCQRGLGRLYPGT